MLEGSVPLRKQHYSRHETHDPVETLPSAPDSVSKTSVIVATVDVQV